MEPPKTDAQTWPELAIGLYDQLTERNAGITYEFEDMRVSEPRSATPDAPVANWTLQGALRVRTKNVQ